MVVYFLPLLLHCMMCQLTDRHKGQLALNHVFVRKNAFARSICLYLTFNANKQPSFIYLKKFLAIQLFALPVLHKLAQF